MEIPRSKPRSSYGRRLATSKTLLYSCAVPSWTQLALFAALSLASAGLTAAMVVLAPVDALVS
ncbi:MAG: hypothetical protein ACI9WU_000847, partial [Myxococcota bacterium]